MSSSSCCCCCSGGGSGGGGGGGGSGGGGGGEGSEGGSRACIYVSRGDNARIGISTQRYHSEVINGRRQMSQRMRMQIEQLEWKLREAAGHIEIV